MLYNLLYYQVLLQVSCELTPSDRQNIRQLAESPVRAKAQTRPFLTALETVIAFFESTQLYEKDEKSCVPGQKSNWDLVDVLQKRVIFLFTFLIILLFWLLFNIL